MLRALFSTLPLFLAALIIWPAGRDPSEIGVNGAQSADLVVLGDGTTMLARQGTLDRAVADWIIADVSNLGSFELGPDTFLADTAELSPVGLAHAAGLAILLHSAPDVQLRPCVPFGTDDDLAPARAITLARFLEDRDLVAGEIEDLSGKQGPICDSTSPAGFAFTLRRRRG